MANLPRFGLVATDAMRIVGLRAILGDGDLCEIVSLSPPSEDSTADLVLMLVDVAEDEDATRVVTTLRRLRPQLALIVLSSNTDPDYVQRVIGSGAKGFLGHAASESELKMAIAVVRDGSVWAPRKVMARLVENSLERAAQATPEPVRLTRRETEVLRLLLLGHPNRQIASLLAVDEGTVKAHMGRLMRKAKVDNRTALTMKAIELGWIVAE